MAIDKIKSRAIKDGTLTNDDFKDGGVAVGNIAPGTIPATAIDNNTITDANFSSSAAIANSKLANSSITVNGNSVSLGGSATIPAGISWQPKVVADGSTQITASNGEGYFVDTTSGIIEVFLPSSPSRGDLVVIVDYGGAASTNKIIINTRGELLDSTEGGPGISSDFKIETNNTVNEFLYTDSNRGWVLKQKSTTTSLSGVQSGDDVYDRDPFFISATGGTETTSGDFKIHTFTGAGCFVVSTVGGPSELGLNKVSYLVVGGGGGGGRNHGGSGGAGGFREGRVSCQPATYEDTYSVSPLNAPDGLAVTATTYPISIGGGGSAGSPAAAPSGTSSTFSTITSAGGGGGGGRNGRNAGNSGGSGGGGSHGGGGGSGNSPPQSPPQGTNGSSASGLNGGRGGSAITSGSVTPSAAAGASTSITGSSVTYSSAAGAGGHSQGASASPNASNRGASGYGGHSGFGHGQAGSQGVVIIRYKYQ